MSDAANTLLSDLERTWRALDSFWREHTDQDTYDLVYRQQQGTTLLLAGVLNQVQALQQANQPDVPPFLSVPWYLMSVLSVNVTTTDAWRIGDGSLVGDPGLTVGSGGATRYVVKLPPSVVDVGYVCDSPLEQTTVVAPPQVSVDAARGELVFTADPFTTFPTYSDGTDTYVDVWLRDVKIDIELIWRSRGWVLGARGESSAVYSRLVEYLYDFVSTKGRRSLEAGAALSVNVPYTTETETSEQTYILASERVLVTDKNVYRHPLGVFYVSGPGTEHQPGEILTTGFEALYGFEQISLSGLVPGLSFNYVDSTGAVHQLTLQSTNTVWSVDDSVSPIRVEFPVGGDGATTFWDDVYARSQAAAAGEDLATLLGISSVADVVPVNPLNFFLEQFHKHDYTVFAFRMDLLARVEAPFLDWVQAYIGAEERFIPLSLFGSAGPDLLDLSVDADGTATAAHHVDATDTLDLSGLPAGLAPLVIIV